MDEPVEFPNEKLVDYEHSAKNSQMSIQDTYIDGMNTINAIEMTQHHSLDQFPSILNSEQTQQLKQVAATSDSMRVNEARFPHLKPQAQSQHKLRQRAIILDSADGSQYTRDAVPELGGA